MPRQRTLELWRRPGVMVRDAPVAVLMFVTALLPGLHGYGTQIGAVPDHRFGGWGVITVAVETLPLILRRRAPALCISLVGAGFAADQLCGYHTFGGIALPLALFSLGAHLDRHRRAAVVLLSAACLLLVLGLNRIHPADPLTDFAILYVMCAAFWSIGSWLRTARRTEAELRSRAVEASRVAERTRIARDLHDVVTHHVTAMVVQTEAARYLAADPEKLDAALAGVGETGRRAISDLRQLLDLLNPDHLEPESLHRLVEHTRAAGQPVELSVQGKAAARTGVEDSMRVVREALTNALKYDHGARTMVRVQYGADEIGVQVSTDGSGSDAGSPGGSGRGLAGLREHIGALGGDFAAGPQADRGFLVQARIPVRSRG